METIKEIADWVIFFVGIAVLYCIGYIMTAVMEV